jgi:propanol-preferring alcohol dehydrogenase
MGAGESYGLKEGDPVIVYGAWGCGRCRNCRLSAETHCENASKLGYWGGGLGRDGAMAEYLLVPSPRLLLPAGKLDPRTAAPLTDAALTPYHAIKRALPSLVPGSTTVVIGVGGLGHVAVQILKAVSATTVVACDVAKDKLALARQVGASEALVSDDGAVQRVKDLTGGLGAEVVLDFVGSDSTLKLGAQMNRSLGQYHLVGLAGGHLSFGFGALPFDTTINVPYWGTAVELMEVLALAEQGKISVHTESFTLRQAPEVYQRLREGQIAGRAVVNP